MTRVDVLLSWRHTSSELPPDEEGLNVLVAHRPGAAFDQVLPGAVRYLAKHGDHVWWARVPLPSE